MLFITNIICFIISLTKTILQNGYIHCEKVSGKDMHRIEKLKQIISDDKSR